MKLNEAIEVLNSKEKTIQTLAKELGSSKDLLANILKSNGYEFNNKTKQREYVGEGSPADIELESVIKERKTARNGGKTTNSSDKKVRKKSDKNQTEIKQEDDLFLTKSEIEFVKKLAKGRSDWDKDFKLNYEFSQLPSRKPSKKVPYEISLETFSKFEEFSEQVGEPRRMSRNDLVEIALQKFMKDFS